MCYNGKVASKLKKNPAVLLNIGIIVVSLVGFALVLYWISGKIQAQAKAIADARSELLLASRSSELLAQFKSDQPEAQRYLQLVQTFLPGNEQLLDFPAWLNGLAANYKLPLDFRFQSEPVSPQGNTPGYIPINFQTTGSFDTLTAFLEQLELKAPRYFISLDNVDLQVQSNGDYQMTCQGKVYFK